MVIKWLIRFISVSVYRALNSSNSQYSSEVGVLLGFSDSATQMHFYIKKCKSGRAVTSTDLEISGVG